MRAEGPGVLPAKGNALGSSRAMRPHGRPDGPTVCREHPNLLGRWPRLFAATRTVACERLPHGSSDNREAVT